jgi:hypothetical protein
MPVADDQPLHDFPDRALRQLLRFPQHLRSLLRRLVPELATDRGDHRSPEIGIELAASAAYQQPGGIAIIGSRKTWKAQTRSGSLFGSTGSDKTPDLLFYPAFITQESIHELLFSQSSPRISPPLVAPPVALCCYLGFSDPTDSCQPFDGIALTARTRHGNLVGLDVPVAYSGVRRTWRPGTGFPSSSTKRAQPSQTPHAFTVLKTRTFVPLRKVTGPARSRAPNHSGSMCL